MRDNITMATTDTTLRLVHSETYSFDVVVYQNNTIVDLTGATIYFTCKWNYSDADASAIFQLSIGSGITVTNASAGAITITIPSSATSSLPYSDLYLAYDLCVITAASKRGFPLRGTLIVSPNVTRS